MNLDPAVLGEVAISVFEDSAFLFVEMVDGLRPTGALLRARIELLQPRHGSLSLTASERLAREIAASMLGLEPAEADAEDARQALGELANVVAGALLAKVFGAGESAGIGLPRVEASPVDEQPGVRACLLVEGGEVIELCASFERLGTLA